MNTCLRVLPLLLLLAACQPAAEPAAPTTTATTAPDVAESAVAPADDAAPITLQPPPGDFHLLEVGLGNAIDGEGRVPQGGTSFAPVDTLYLSVLGSASSEPLQLSARWLTAAGELIAEDQQPVPAGAASLTRFRLANPQGWPAGGYKVELAINGQVIDHRQFLVVAPTTP